MGQNVKQLVEKLETSATPYILRLSHAQGKGHDLSSDLKIYIIKPLLSVILKKKKTEIIFS